MWIRLSAWFGVAFATVYGVCIVLFHFYALQDDIRETLFFMAAVFASFLVVGYLASRKEAQPVESVSRQLDLIEASKSQHKIWVDETTPEMKQLINQINALLSRLHLSDIRLNQFSTQVAHELRTPLTIMRLKIEQAAEKIEPRLADEIQAELFRLTRRVEQALLIARAEQGQMTITPIQFDLQEMLQSATEDFQILADEEKRSIHFAVSRSHSIFIIADPNYTRQILDNLFANALKHGKGDIHIRVAHLGNDVSVIIANAIKPIESDMSLGFGKRIIAALVALHHNMHCQTRKTKHCYVARLTIAAMLPQ